MSGEDNSEEVKVLEAHVQCLQAEVEALQRHQQDLHLDKQYHFKGRMQEALAYLCGPYGQDEESLLSGLKEEVEKLEEHLKEQTEMNKIDLDSFTKKTLQSSGSEVVHLSGRCCELEFEVELQISADQEDQKSEKAISDLSVVLNSSDVDNFRSFLTQVEESRDLLLFFRTLRSFTDSCEHRSKNFQHFQNKYPSVVSLPGGCRSEVMTMNHPELPGCVFFLHWSVEVSREGAVAPKLDLVTKIPTQALQLLPSWPVDGACEEFHNLLSIMGPEAAIESLIRAVSLSQDS